MRVCRTLNGHLIFPTPSAVSALALVCALAAAPGAAQNTTGPPEEPDPAVDVDPSGDVVQADEIVVTAYRQQVLEASEIERAASNIVSVITADDIGAFPDQNIAESLQRVPGLTIIRDEGEGRFVTIRGLAPEFTQTTVSNAQIGSSDAGGNRSVALDVIPSDLLSQVTVNKTLLPDQDHDSLGAKVDLRPLSAFSRPEPLTGRLTVQGTLGDIANEIDPKISADITFRTQAGPGELGIALAGNYFERTIRVDRLQSSSGGGIREERGFIIPQELDQRVEFGKRERIGGSVSLDYNIDDRHEWNFSALYGQLDDEDIRLQQEVELRDAREDEIGELGPNSGTFSDVDLERLIFFQPRIEETYALHFEGSNLFGENWRLAYAVDYSKNNFTLEDGLRGRFRERDLIVAAQYDEDSADFQVLGEGQFDDDETDFDFRPTLEDFDYNQILIIDEDRDDEIFSYNVDVERYLTFGSVEASVKAGFKHRMRDREFLRGEREGDPEDVEEFDGLTLADVPTFIPKTGLNLSGDLDDRGTFPQIDAFRDLVGRTRDALDLQPQDRRADFTAGEDTLAGYLLADVDFMNGFSVIAGVRVENTDYTTSGNVLREIELTSDDETLFSGASTTAQSFDNDYTEWFPAVHLRWEATDELVARFSYYKSQVRPGFGDARALQELSFELATPEEEPGEEVITVDIDGTPTQVVVIEAELEGGNPFLQPLTADQFDFTLGYYPADNTSIRLAAFYKDLTNVFIEVDASTPEAFEALGFDPVDEVTGIPLTEVETVINGSSGELYGVELAVDHFLDYLPGVLDGLFVTGNLTLIEGETSSPLIRDGEIFTLPNQSDMIANASVGYEDERFLVRVSGNYRGEQLLAVDADDAFADIFIEDFFSVDLSLRINIMDRFRVFFDAINLNEENERRVYRGGEAGGRIYNRIEDFGRTYQVGVTASF